MKDTLQRVPNKKSRTLPLLLIVILLIAFMMAGIAVFPLRWAVQLFILILMSLDLYYITRYRLSEHEYELSGENLIIRRLSGRRTVKVLEADCGSILFVCRPDAPENTDKKKSRVINCRSTLKIRGEVCAYVYFEDDRGASYRLIFEPDDTTLCALRERIGERLHIPCKQ